MTECPPILTTRTAVILAAGSPPAALSSIIGHTSSAMVPVSGRPIIHWLLHNLHDLGIRRVVLGIRAGETRLPRFVRNTFFGIMEVTFVPVGEDLGPGFTLLQCLKEVPSQESCLVVLGDTLFEFEKQNPERFAGDFVLVNPVPDSSRWCIAEIDGSHEVTSLADKQPSNPGGWPALIGVYHFAESAPARQALEKTLASGSRSLQLRHALEPYIAARSLKAWPAGQWFDCGNLDFLTSSRRRLLQARSFNTIQIDELRGTITKRSTHGTKFLNEINYYRLVPPDLAIFFPRLVDFSLNPEDLFLTLEYYGYSTLSEMWVFEELDATYWETIFDRLLSVIRCFGKYSAPISRSATFSFYWSKTVDRLETFTGQSESFAQLVSAKEILLNQEKLAGWGKIRGEIEGRVKDLSQRTQGQIIHGDLCFPNILYDPLSRLFKFIDPRGSFADSGIYGDMRYDVAKLLHSLHGGYDFLIHDMFMLKHSGTDLELRHFFPESRPAVLKSFERIFGQVFDLKEVRLLEGLLFVSMCPLHQDYPDRQRAMFATGLRILNEVLNNEDMH